MARTKQALVVEKDDDLAAELAALLRQLGFAVTTLDDAAAVQETLGVHRYEVALINLTLPDLSWRKTYLTVKNASKTTRVIMITRTASEVDIRLALNAGAYIALDGPLTRDQVGDLLCSERDGLFVVLRGPGHDRSENPERAARAFSGRVESR